LFEYYRKGANFDVVEKISIISFP